MNWYVVQTKPKQEKFTQMNLERIGVETFYPQLKQTKVIRRKYCAVTGPLFPGYLFARFKLETQQRMINYSPGVKRLVSFGTTLAMLEDDVIHSIKMKMENGFVTISHSPSFTSGQKVRIYNGPLQGLEAVFEREMSGSQRALVLLNSLSFRARVAVDFADIVGL